MTSPQAEAVIDLAAYRHNLEQLSAHVGDAAVMAVVKADAYGHGAPQIARTAREAGVQWLGVTTIDEALTVRKNGDNGPLLCWLAAPGADFKAALDADIEVTASSVAQLSEITAVAGQNRAKVQLKVDTGLSRNGALGAEFAALLEAAAAAQSGGHIEVTGIWSHLACADEPQNPANAAQESVFASALAQAAAQGIEPRWRHLSNSAAALTRPSAHFDLVRLGIASYGVNPAPNLDHRVDLRPVMTVRGRLAAVKDIEPGAGVSYGHTFIAQRPTTVGLVPLGYGEGVPVAASNRVLLGYCGRPVPLIGRVCMDQIMVDLTDIGAAPAAGDVVTLFGAGDDGEPTANAWAEATGTIGYEIVTRIGGRVVRTYRDAT